MARISLFRSISIAAVAAALGAGLSPAAAQEARISSIAADEGATLVRQRANGSFNGTVSGSGSTIRFAGLPAGARVRMASVSDMGLAQHDANRTTPIPTRCRAAYSGGFPSDVEGTVAADGTLTLTPNLTFAVPDDGGAASATGPCSGSLAILVTRPLQRMGVRNLDPGVTQITGPATAITAAGARTGPQLMFLPTPSFAIRPWTVYRYTDTWALRRIFAFAMLSEGASSCSGTSIGPASFPIGPHNRNGDLAIQVRSGPAGTICRAASPGVALPKNVRLVAIDWAVERDGTKCLAGDDAAFRAGETTIIAPGHLTDDVPGTYMGGPQAQFASLFRITQPRVAADQHIIGFAHAWMVCDQTLVNDHGVRIVLRSATFEGPANADLP